MKKDLEVFTRMFIEGLRGRLDRVPCANNFRHTLDLFQEMGIHAKNFQALRDEGCRCDCEVLNLLDVIPKKKEKKMAEVGTLNPVS